MEVPLFLIPLVIRQEIKKAGEELERIVVKKSGRHYYNISIRSRSINRELRAGVVRAGTGGAGRVGP
jgi:hypothetical protein